MKKSILGAGLLAAVLSLSLAAQLDAAPLNQPPAEPAGGSGVPEPEPQFTKVIDDLPLMPGLQLVEDEDVLFSAPGSGRIAETNAVGPVDIDAVYSFYKKSLPHLGWKAVNAHTYEREGEKLSISARANNKITLVHFAVKPVGSK